MKQGLLILSLTLFLRPGGLGQTYFLNGNAQALGDDCYQLTGLGNTENGTVWYGEQIDLNEPFDLLFYMNYGSLDANGADGICFVLQTVGTAAIGESGGGLGYLNFGTSLGIEFDTWQNSEYGDIVQDHVAIERDGSIDHNSPLNLAGPVTIDPLGLNVEDGQDHLVRINWDPENFQIRVYYECEFRLSATIDLVSQVFGGQNLVYWGFTAATGGASNIQIVCLEENILASQDEVYTCPGLPAQLSAGGVGGGNYTWTPAEGLDDPNSPTPIASVDETTVFNVEFVDACGTPGTGEVTVYVEPLIATTPSLSELNCHNPSLEIIGTANFPAQFLTWSWVTDDGNIVNGAGTSSPLIDEPGEYTYVISYEGFCADTGAVMVEADYSDFSLSMEDPLTITCINDEVEVGAISDPLLGVTYTWTTLDGNIITNTNAQYIVVNGPGTYFVQAYLNDFCNEGSSVEVEANFDTPNLTFNVPSVVNCYNNEIEINVLSSPESTNYSWVVSDGGNIVAGQGTSNIVVDAGGNYMVVALHPISGCPTDSIIVVEENFVQPLINELVADTLDCLHPEVSISVEFSAAEEVSYDWTVVGLGNIVAGASASEVQVNEPGTYQVVLTNLENGCSISGSTEVVEDDLFNLDLSGIQFPNVFTPNDDGKNREWRPFLLEDPEFDLTQVFNSYSLLVYNRWGSLIFESTDSKRSWTDREADQGTYYYVLSYESLCGTGVKEERAGYIQLLK